jgi:ferredoxin
MGMKVWIDQDLCTGDGLCEEIAPAVFTLLDDGLAYVKEGTKVFNPGGAENMAAVPAGMEDDGQGSASSSRPSDPPHPEVRQGPADTVPPRTAPRTLRSSSDVTA